MIRLRQTSLAFRLVIAFVSMAVMGVVIVVALAVTLGGRDIDAMVNERRADLTRALAANAAAAYNTGRPSWSDVDLRPALDFAARRGTRVAVTDGNGRSVASTITDPAELAGASRTPITVDGERVGTLAVSFAGGGPGGSEDKLRSSLVEAVTAAAVSAVLVALVVALVVARRLARPVGRIVSTTRARGEGDRTIRIGPLHGAPRELTELCTAFDRMADAVELQDRLRRELLSDVAHELRTPIAILQANCEALLDGVVPHTPEQTASLQEEVLRLARLVEDVQALATAHAPALRLSPVLCDLSVLVDAAVDAMAPRLATARLTVTRRLEPTLIEGDPARLHQVISNVLANAQKFTLPGGQIDVALSTRDGYGRLEVTDTGIGLAPEDQSHVFERFWRGGNADRADGSGIGLAVVAKLVEAHHGHVTVESRLGEGTSVVITLPTVHLQ